MRTPRSCMRLRVCRRVTCAMALPTSLPCAIDEWIGNGLHRTSRPAHGTASRFQCDVIRTPAQPELPPELLRWADHSESSSGSVAGSISVEQSSARPRLRPNPCELAGRMLGVGRHHGGQGQPSRVRPRDPACHMNRFTAPRSVQPCWRSSKRRQAGHRWRQPRGR